jgi:hypothetical protein
VRTARTMRARHRTQDDDGQALRWDYMTAVMQQQHNQCTIALATSAVPAVFEITFQAPLLSLATSAVPSVFERPPNTPEPERHEVKNLHRSSFVTLTGSETEELAMDGGRHRGTVVGLDSGSAVGNAMVLSEPVGAWIWPSLLLIWLTGAVDTAHAKACQYSASTPQAGSPVRRQGHFAGAGLLSRAGGRKDTRSACQDQHRRGLHDTVKGSRLLDATKLPMAQRRVAHNPRHICCPFGLRGTHPGTA